MKNSTAAVVLAAIFAMVPLVSYAQVSVSVGGPGGVNVTSGQGPTNYGNMPYSYMPQNGYGYQQPQQYSYGYQPQQYSYGYQPSSSYAYGYNPYGSSYYPNSYANYYNTSAMPYYSSYPQYSYYPTGTYDAFGGALCQWSDYSYGATSCANGDPQQWVFDPYTGTWY